MAGDLEFDETSVRRSRLFDSAWYVARYPDALCEWGSLSHFLRHGAAEGRHPNPAFDVAFYARSHMVANDERNPLVHYLIEGASRALETHPLFDQKWYARRYLHERATPLATLVHYVTVGRRLHYWPNAFLDPIYYLLSNPDVLRAGLDPLSHYHEHGDREGRPPSAHFDRASVLRALPQASRSEAETGVLAFTIGRGAEVSRLDQITYDAGDAERLQAAITRLLDPALATVALVSHGSGGGVGRLVQDRRHRLKGQRNTVLVTGRQDLVRLEVEGPDRSIAVAFGPHDLRELPALLTSLRVDLFEIHHVLDVPRLKALLAGTGTPFVLFLHDYYVLSPSPHLVGPDGCFVGEDLERHENALLAASYGAKPLSLRAWRRDHAWLLKSAIRLIAPSEDTRRRYLRQFPDSNIEVEPPEPEGTPRCALRIRPRRIGPAHVGILGRLSAHKGYEVVRATAEEAAAQRAPVRFTLIGSSHDDEALRRSGVAVSGYYDDAVLSGLIEAAGFDWLWYPSQAPETYCYTLSAGLRSGLPLLVSDLGALPDRIAGVEGCRAMDWRSSPAEWLAAMNLPSAAEAEKMRDGMRSAPWRSSAAATLLEVSRDGVLTPFRYAADKVRDLFRRLSD